MIPLDRPVIGKDLDTVRQQFGLLTADALWLFGLSASRWTKVVRQEGHLPVNDPSLALLVRFLDMHPELSVIPKFPTATEIFELINKTQTTKQREFSVMMGAEGSAAFRWLKRDGRQSPFVGRLMHYLRQGLQAYPAESNKRASLIDEWRDVVTAEARARDALDVFNLGKWNIQGVAEKKDQAAKIAESEMAASGIAGVTKPKKGAKKKNAAGLAKSESE